MKRILLSGLFFLLFFATPNALKAAMNAPQKVVLGNGFEAILIENHATPVVASVVTVKAGSANESLKTNGIAHMLEHLLFNGTTKRTQKELYDEADFFGIYNNAHTGRDYTNYIVLAEKGNAEHALDIQADMLFNSVIPNDKFKKEKGIILNEIANNMSSSSFYSTEQFNRNFFFGTAYNMPVLGFPESIENASRESVLEYYKTYYVPNNASAIIMGDFDSKKMIATLDRLFGIYPPGKIPARENNPLNKQKTSSTHHSKMKVEHSTLTLGLPLPSLKDKDFYPLSLLGMYIDSDLKTRINEQLKKLGSREILSAWAGVDYNQTYSFFKSEVAFSANLNPEIVQKAFMAAIQSYTKDPINEARITGLLTSSSVDEITLFEKPHYYGMMKGQSIAAGGWDFTRNFLHGLEESRSELKRVADSYLSAPQFMVSLITPGEDTYKEIKEKVKTEYYKKKRTNLTYTPESLERMALWKSGKREIITKRTGEQKTLSKQSASTGKPVIQKSVLNNGLTLIINANPYSEVFAVHLLAKNRSALEPEGKSGIADFLHRIMAKGPQGINESDFRAQLASIGATIKTHDNDSIPYDNHYTSNEYSFIRYQTVDRFYKKALDQFSQIITNPSFEKNKIDQVREEMKTLLQKQNSDPARRSNALFNEKVFAPLSLSKPINGTEESLGSIEKNALKEFYKKYFSPENLILTISTSLPPDVIHKAVEASLGKLHKIPVKSVPQDFSQAVTQENASISETIGKPQSYIRAGKIFKINKEEKGPLRVLGALLSDKMGFEMREKMGLAYSLGAGYGFYGDYALFKASIGTRPDTLEVTRAMLQTIITQMAQEVVDKKDVERTANLYISRSVMRQLSRMNQSFYLAVEEFRNLPVGTLKKSILDLKKVTPEMVTAVAKKYLSMENIIEVTVE